MDELLRLLADHYGFLWGESWYRIVDSRTTESFGNALVILASECLRVQVGRDRGKFLWRLQAPGARERDWYDLSGWNLTADGHCGRCGAACAGVFEPRPGRWGRRRTAVRVSAMS